MEKLSTQTVEAIRQAKLEGLSLREISKTFRCAKSTASLYCRDVFNYRGRIYGTEAVARKAIVDRNRGICRRYPVHGCLDCQKLIRLEHTRCLHCQTVRLKRKALNRYIQYCEQKAAEPRRESKYRRSVPILIDPCPVSLTQRHHYMIDSLNRGMCKHCGKEKQFEPKRTTTKPILT